MFVAGMVQTDSVADGLIEADQLAAALGFEFLKNRIAPDEMRAGSAILVFIPAAFAVIEGYFLFQLRKRSHLSTRKPVDE